MTSQLPNDSRVTARIPASMKETLQKAADLTGTTLNQFLIRAALKEAEEVISRERVIHLSEDDADRIFALIDNPPSPNAYLKKAISRHRIFFSETDRTSSEDS